MKKFVKTLGTATYIITAILYLITMMFNYNSVSSNLDGVRGFSSGHAMIFAIVCFLLGALCIYNTISLIKDKTKSTNIVTGIILIGLPIVFNLVISTLQGNIDTDFQYLIFRTFQGFEYTYLYLIITAILSFISLILNRKEN